MTITAAALEAAPAGSIVRYAADGEPLAVKTTDADGTPWHAPKLTRAGGDDLWHSADSLLRELARDDMTEMELVTPTAPAPALDRSTLATALSWAAMDQDQRTAALSIKTLDEVRELTEDLTTAAELAEHAVRDAHEQRQRIYELRDTIAGHVQALIPPDVRRGERAPF